MRTDEAFYNISMYLYNKNVLEYAQIARNETESKIPYIEGCSNIHILSNELLLPGSALVYSDENSKLIGVPELTAEIFQSCQAPKLNPTSKPPI